MFDYDIDANDQVTKLTDPAGRIHDYGYDATGDLLESYWDLDNKQWDYDYDANTRLEQMTDPEGNITRFGYDGQQQELASITRVNSQGPDSVWTFDTSEDCTTFDASYDAQRCTIVGDPEGGTTVHYLSGPDRVVRTVDQLDRTREREYNANGDVETATDGLSNTTKILYDDNVSGSGTFNVVGTEIPTGATTSIDYQTAGEPYLPSRSTDAQGNDTNYTYDAAGRIDTISSGPAGAPYSTWDVDHTSFGEVDKITDPAGNTTDFVYDNDPNKHLDTRTPAGPIGTTQYEYDSLSRLERTEDPRGVVTIFRYDKMDRIVKVQQFPTPTSPTPSITTRYDYDDAGNRISRTMSDASGQQVTTWVYDDLNRLVTEYLPGGIPGVFYTYDRNSNITSITDSGGTVDYDHDAANQLDSMAVGGDTVTFDYDDAGNRELIEFPNDTQQQMAYDTSNRLERITGSTDAGTKLTERLYTYTDPDNSNADTTLRHTEQDTLAGWTATYDYDVLNRLEGATGGPQDYAYDYDTHSNRIEKTVDTTTTTYTFNDSNQLTKINGSTAASYDAAGHQSFGPTGTITVDDAGRTEAIGGKTYTYAGGDQTQRLSRTNGTAVEEYFPSSNGLAGRDNGTGYLKALRDDRGRLLGQQLGNDTYWHLYDGLGSTLAVTDDTGSVVNSYTYTPYGDTVTVSEQFTNPYRYIGQAGYYYDGTTGLYQVGHRIYQPELGVWTQPDPSGQEPNTYLYAAANPINKVDPSGLHWQGIVDAASTVLDAASAADAVASGEIREFAASTAGGVFVEGVCVAGALAATGVTAGLSAGAAVACTGAGVAAGYGFDYLYDGQVSFP